MGKVGTMLTVGLAGHESGKMDELASIDHLIAPSSSVHRIEEAQTTIYNVPWAPTLAALCRPSWRDDRQ